MRVSSPIGELPFTALRLHLRRDGLVVDGVMGAWPAHVVVEAADAPSLARLAARPVLLLGGGLVALALARALLRRTRS